MLNHDMDRVSITLRRAVAALALAAAMSSPAAAQNADLDALFERLREATPETYEQIEDQIWTEWSRSGSASMDFLLNRGRDAIEEGELREAVEHLTALTDHAPDFAEGFHMRATAFFRMEMYGPAMADLERTLALNPRHFGAMIGTGIILDEVGEDEAALRMFRRVQAIHPNRPDVNDAVERLERETAGTSI